MESKKRAKVTFEDIMKILVSTSNEDWIVSDEFGSYTYKDDVLLRIQMRKIDYKSAADKFSEKWITECSNDLTTNTPAYRAIYDIFYCNSWITQKVLVSVDGGRAILPLPRLGTHDVPHEEYQFAKIVAPDSLDDYMSRFKLTVES